MRPGHMTYRGGQRRGDERRTSKVRIRVRNVQDGTRGGTGGDAQPERGWPLVVVDRALEDVASGMDLFNSSVGRHGWHVSQHVARNLHIADGTSPQGVRTLADMAATILIIEDEQDIAELCVTHHSLRDRGG